MTSFQSSLEDTDIADELAERQRQISIAEFFEKNKQMLGFDSEARALVTAVKEAVDNAFDATEEADFLPDIYVEIREDGDYYTVIVEDNGPGITKEQIPNVFGKLLYGSRFHKREQSLVPTEPILLRRDGTVDSATIGEFCDNHLSRPDGDQTAPLSEGIEAPCFNRTTGEITWQPVTHVIRHETNHATYRVTTTDGRTVSVTGNHSLFTIGPDGSITEVPAKDLDSGDTILAPASLPFAGESETINLLEYTLHNVLEENEWTVCDVPTDVIEQLEGHCASDESPRNPAPDERASARQGLTTAELEKREIPATVICDLDLETKVVDCHITINGNTTASHRVPVSVPLSSQVLRRLARTISIQSGRAGDNHHQSIASDGGHTTADYSNPHSGLTDPSPPGQQHPADTFQALTAITWSVRGLPAFIFASSQRLQAAFLDELFTAPQTPTDTAEKGWFASANHDLIRDVSFLLSMHGIEGSVTTQRESDNGPVYRITVSVDQLKRATDPTTSPLPESSHIPAKIVAPLAVADPARSHVPASQAGVFLAAGLGTTLDAARNYVETTRALIENSSIPNPQCLRELEAHDLVTPANQPTDHLIKLWRASKQIETFGDSDLTLQQVATVEEIEAPEYVYDISVPGTGRDENFVAGANGPVCVKNSRGQQGIGISAAVLYAQLTSGKPAKITSRTPTGDTAQYFELVIDTENNEPEIRSESSTTWDRPHGTRIELHMEANMRARTQLHDYITHTAVVNPHGRIELVEPNAEFKFDRATDTLPKDTEEIRPHPHGVELGTLIKMLEATDSYSLSGFLQGEFTRVGGKTAQNVLNNFRDRHYGRAMAWQPPPSSTEQDLETSIIDAVANKPADATASFAREVTEAISDAARVSHLDIVGFVDVAADAIEADSETIFGSTVRENAVTAAWTAITADLEDDLYALVDDATSSRKDTATIRGLADRLAAKFDSHDDPRHRLTQSTLRSYVERSADDTEQFDDATIGETARENVTEHLWATMRTVPVDQPRVTAVADDRDAASDLLEAMRATDILAPPTDCLSPITAEQIEAGLQKVFNADFYAAATRDAEVHGGDPFIVEAGLAYGGDLEEGPVDLMRFANRVPLVYQRGACATTDVLKSINWRNYNLDQPGGTGIPNGPAVLLVHVASTNVPFTSESKDAVANIPTIEQEIERALREVGRELKAYLNKRRSLQQRRKKQDVLASILPEMATKVAEVTGRAELSIDDTMARIMNNVLVERHIENETVQLSIENHTDGNVSLDVTDIVSTEPADVNGATVVEMDDEWFVKWTPEIKSGSDAVLEYSVDAEAAFDLSIDGIEPEKLTIDA